MTQNELENVLLEVRVNWSSRDLGAIQEALKSAKVDAIKNLNEITAKNVWILQTIFSAQSEFINAFNLCKDKKFYDGWCSLERAEHAIGALKMHHVVDTQYELDFIKKYIPQFQSLFPYKIFMSPEFVGMIKKCSICKSQISFRNPCGHRVGEIYMGEMCGRIIENISLAAMALVENPVQKYSVPFTPGGDQYNYTLIEYAVSALASPFHGWSYEETKTWHPHDNFKKVGRNGPCPCGSEPAKKYKKCCLPKPGILWPHVQFLFEENLPEDLPPLKYSY